jgi:peptidyl-prolyl cis-trans isomerase C
LKKEVVMNSSVLPLKLAASLTLLGAALSMTGAMAQTPAAPAELSLSVKINGQASPAERGELLLKEQLARGVADSAQLRNAIRESLINQAVMAQEALKLSLDKQPLGKARLDLAQQNTLAQMWQQKALQDVVISEAQIKAEYEAQLKALGTQEYLLRHVLLADEQQASDLMSKIKGGAKFDALAQEFSRDPVTRDKGGLSVWVAEGRLAPAIVQAVQTLKNGQMTAQPVQTPSGWQVIRLEEKRALTPPALESVTPQIRSALAQKQLQAKLSALRAAAKVE